MKTSVFCGISFDGFLAREMGELDWLTVPDEKGNEVDHGFDDFFKTVDVLVMGRNTFDLVVTFDKWYYGDKRVVVLSSRDIKIPAHLSDKVETMKGEPAEVLDRLSKRGFKHAYIDGGVTIQRFLRAGLIDRMVISRLPILIGQGIPLFGRLEKDIKLKLVSTRTYPGGMVQSEYEVKKSR